MGADLLDGVESAAQRRRLPLQRRLHPRQVLGRRGDVARQALHVPAQTICDLIAHPGGQGFISIRGLEMGSFAMS